MATLDDIDLSCPVCESEFRSRRISSTDSVGQDTDFRPLIVGVDPQRHYVHVCPQCRFAAFEGDYGDIPEPVRSFVARGAHEPEDVLRDEPAPSDLSGSTRYLLAARCYSHDDRASELRLADLYLRASWCARQEGRSEREREAQIEAVLLFEKAVEAGEVADDQQRTILYLVGELYRRIGRHEFAGALFDSALAAPEGADADGRIEALIRRQKRAAQDGETANMQIDDP